MPTVRMVEPMYRGKPCEVDMSVALANSGAMQIELIWQKNAAPSIYKDFLDAGRTGLQHVGFFVDDIEATLISLLQQPPARPDARQKRFARLAPLPSPPFAQP
jgi:hypothetical protein